VTDPLSRGVFAEYDVHDRSQGAKKNHQKKKSENPQDVQGEIYDTDCLYKPTSMM
jgi:hypothetical protein